MSLLKPTQMEELKKLASANLESALMAAARIGATRSGNAAKPIKRAAAILEYEAEIMKSSFDGAMNSEAKQTHDEYKRIAKALRDLLTPGEAAE